MDIESNQKELKKFVINIMFISVIFTFVFYFLFHLLVYLFFIKSEAYISSGIGAFMGAFAAFIFLIIERAFAKYRERRVKHFNALVKAEYILNENLQLISDNIYMVDGFIKVLNEGKLHAGSFNPLVWEQNILIDLANLEIINRLSAYATNIRKTNRDLNAMESWYEQLKLAFVQKNIDKNTYDVNVAVLVEQIKIIRKFLVKVDNETLVRQSEIRVMMKQRNFIDWFFDKISDHRLPKDFEEKVKREQSILKKEREDIRTTSQKELEDLKET